MVSGKKPLVIVGAGGFGKEALWLAAEMNHRAGEAAVWDLRGFVDDRAAGGTFCGLPVLCTSDTLAEHLPPGTHFHCALGRNADRQLISEKLEAAGFVPATLIHPTVVIGPEARIEPGVFIGPLSIVAPSARVGRHTIINTHVGVGHDAVVGEFCNLCPGARVNGGCHVGPRVMVGSNASLQPGVRIGEGASVCANSFVIRNVKPGTTVTGTPARAARGARGTPAAA